MIGIVGGVGPLAGIDIAKKIIEETIANKDQDHIPFILSSQPHKIADRTAYLQDNSNENPAYALAEIILELEEAGATLTAIPCNTAHAPQIFNVIEDILEQKKSKIKVLHLVEETAKFIAKNYPNKKVGILSTTGTRDTKLYTRIFEKYAIPNLSPDDDLQLSVHDAIYNGTYGIKAQSSPVTLQAKKQLEKAIEILKKQEAEIIVLACTELPLALTGATCLELPLIDPNRILARSLITYESPAKLK